MYIGWAGLGMPWNVLGILLNGLDDQEMWVVHAPQGKRESHWQKKMVLSQMSVVPLTKNADRALVSFKDNKFKD